MKTVHLLLILLAASGVARASSAKVDSLKRVLQSQAPVDKAEVLWAIAYELFDVDNPQALFYAERAYHEVWAKGDSLQIVKVGTTYGQLLRRRSFIDRSMEVSMLLLPIAKRHDFRKYTKILLNSLAMAYQELGEIDKAIILNHESLDMRRVDNDSSEIASALVNLGYMNYLLLDASRAIAILNEALLYMNPKKDIRNIMLCHINLAASYSLMGQCDVAETYYWKSISATKIITEVGIICDVNRGIAWMKYFCGKLDSAKFYASHSLGQSIVQMNIYSATMSSLILSRVELEKGNYKLSFNYLKLADSLIASAKYPELYSDVLEQKMKYFIEVGDSKEAVKAMQIYLTHQDQQKALRRNSRIRQVQIQFAQKENLEKLKLQASMLEFRDKAISAQRMFLVGVIALLAVVLVLLMELWRAYKQKKQVNERLDAIVVERTAELVKQRDIIRHNFDEQRVLKQNASRALLGLGSSLDGLVYLIRVDKGTEQQEYLKRMENALSNLKHIAGRLGDNSELEKRQS